MTLFSWNRGSGRLADLGAILTDLEFQIGKNQIVKPLHKAPWLGEKQALNTPPIIANLQGEWPCVPFGMTPSNQISNEWQVDERPLNEFVHGYGSNHLWKISQSSPNGAEAEIKYPNYSNVQCINRSVTGVHNQATVKINLNIIMRKDAYMPIGLHPVFRLPKEVGAAHLELGDYGQVFGYPGDTGGKALTNKLSQYKINDSLLKLPYEEPSETILLVTEVKGHITLKNYAEGYQIHLDWDAKVFPSLLLWISNRGRNMPPWNSRHTAIGIEPICSAFDFGTNISIKDNPLNKLGVKTSVFLSSKKPFSTTYKISAAYAST